MTAFEKLLTAASLGYTMWAMKPHNKKWRRRLEGTPIVNDLLVCVCKEISEQMTERLCAEHLVSGEAGNDGG